MWLKIKTIGRPLRNSRSAASAFSIEHARALCRAASPPVSIQKEDLRPVAENDGARDGAFRGAIFPRRRRSRRFEIRDADIFQERARRRSPTRFQVQTQPVMAKDQSGQNLRGK